MSDSRVAANPRSPKQAAAASRIRSRVRSDFVLWGVVVDIPLESKQDSKMATAAENKQIVSDAYRALASGDVKGFLGVLHPEIEVHEPAALPYGGTYHGVGELIGMFGKAGPVLDSGALVVDSLTADEDRVIAVIRMPLRSAAGEALIAEHWTLADGKATQIQVFWFDTTIVG
jgi:ketosteroid isomerase-like protein